MTKQQEVLKRETQEALIRDEVIEFVGLGRGRGGILPHPSFKYYTIDVKTIK